MCHIDNALEPLPASAFEAVAAETAVKGDAPEAFKRTWLGRGWDEICPGSNAIWDAVHGVKIDVLLSGDHPRRTTDRPMCHIDNALEPLPASAFEAAAAETAVKGDAPDAA